MELLKNDIQKLPTYVINKIISYTYSPQCPIHLENIKHYIKTKKMLGRMYYMKYTFNRQIPYHMCMFRGDLFRYLHFNLLCNKLNKMCYRHILFTNKKNIKKFIKKFDRNNTDHYVVNSHIKILWGILYPNEREEFIINHFSTNEILDACLYN